MKVIFILYLLSMVGIVKAIAQDQEPKKSANDHPLDSVFNSQSKDNGEQEQNSDLDMMFYPGIQSIYIAYPGSLKVSVEGEYVRRPYDQVLYCSKYVPRVGGQIISRINYYYHTKNNRIVSTFQEYYDFVHNKVEAYKDTITLLAIPSSKEPIKWVEHKQGGSYSCVAKYIYILNNGMKRKVVKVEKTKKRNKKQVEWEYWMPYFGRILSYVKFGNDKPVVTERIKMPGLGATIKEIPM